MTEEQIKLSNNLIYIFEENKKNIKELLNEITKDKTFEIEGNIINPNSDDYFEELSLYNIKDGIINNGEISIDEIYNVNDLIFILEQIN